MLTMIEENSARQLSETASKSMKWTTLAEVLAKLIVPITNMILSRFLAPEIFGIVASVNVVITFAELVSEGGFAKFILQQKFTSEEQKKKSVATGLTVSLVFGLLLFLLCFSLKDPLSSLVGASGYSWLLVFASAQLPIYALTNVLLSLCRRSFKFKQLTFVRLLGVLCQLCVAVTFAVLGLSIWAITAGSMASIVIQFVLALIIVRKEIAFGFSLRCFKQMWSSSLTFLLSAFVVWLNASLNTLFSSRFLGQDVAGILKNGFGTISGIINMLTAIYSPVLISLLAKIDYTSSDYSGTIYKFQKAISAILIPLGVGMVVYNRFLTEVFFGSGWEDAGIVIACIGFANSVKVSTCDFVFAGMNARGKPIWNLLLDLIYTICLAIIWPLCRNQDFHMIVLLLGCSILLEAGICLLVSKKTIGVSSIPLLKNLLPVIPCAAFMGFFGYLLTQLSSNLFLNFLFVGSCVVVYFVLLFFSFPEYLSLVTSVFGIRLSNVRKKRNGAFDFRR